MKWVIDPTQTPVLNRAFRDWNADFFGLLKAGGMSVVCSFSQELVQPPDNPAGGAVWVQRFPDSTPVETGPVRQGNGRKTNRHRSVECAGEKTQPDCREV